MPAPRNRLAPPARNVMAADNSSWYDPLIEFAARNIPLPKNDLPKRAFMETVRGDKSPITERHLNPAQLAAITDLVRMSDNPTGVGYSTYDRLASELNNPNAPKRAYSLDDLNDVKMTLGMFNYVPNPKGGLQITDNYDFNSEVPNVIGAVMKMGPAGIVRAYGGRHIKPGQGRKVDILIGGRR